MTDKFKVPQCIDSRLVVIDPRSMRILTTSVAASPLLPREPIPAYERLAEVLTKAIEQRFGLRTIQLALLPGTEDLSHCAVHEIISSQQSVPESLSFTTLDEIASGELTETEEAFVLRIINGEAKELGRFARLGWIDELIARIRGYQDLGISPIIRQLNQGIDFCLLSLTDANGRKVWFKAVGEPNAREYALTAELTRRFPAYLPKILVTIPEWNGWVMEDVRGVPLNESSSIYQCEQAFAALAIMQKEMAGDVISLSAMGAEDWTCVRIASLLEPFFTEAQCAMLAQTSPKSKPLASNELHQLKKDIDSALIELMNAGIPETLLHGDIGHGNIFATPNGPVFLDWAETYLGNPFLSAEHLLADLARSSPLFAEKKAALRSHYAACWKAQIRPVDLEKVTALGPALAAFAYAVIAWDTNRDRPDPTQAWPLLRSMLRRTKRELDQTSRVIA